MPDKKNKEQEVKPSEEVAPATINPIDAAVQRLAILQAVSAPKYRQTLSTIKVQMEELTEQQTIAKSDVQAVSNRISEMTNFLESLGMNQQEIQQRVEQSVASIQQQVNAMQAGKDEIPKEDAADVKEDSSPKE
jgi:hypothetical protein